MKLESKKQTYDIEHVEDEATGQITTVDLQTLRRDEHLPVFVVRQSASNQGPSLDSVSSDLAAKVMKETGLRPEQFMVRQLAADKCAGHDRLAAVLPFTCRQISSRG